MRFREFEKQIRPLRAFNLNDIRKIDPAFHKPQLSDWVGRGYIRPLAGGFYIMADLKVDEPVLFMLANEVYKPSYISRESALAAHGMIPETVLGVTSVSSRKTRRFDTHLGRFSYRSIRPDLMFGYRVVKRDEYTRYSIATLEKAVLDTLYWNPDIQSAAAFEQLRWNRDLAAELVKSQEFGKYLLIFNSKALERRVVMLKEYIHA